MFELGVVYRNIPRADGEVATQLGALGAATVHEAMGRVGLLKPYMRPIYPGARTSGTAVTVTGTNLANGIVTVGSQTVAASAVFLIWIEAALAGCALSCGGSATTEAGI